MFVVIEGIDGSGKTTQISLLKQALEDRGKTVKIFDFPRYTEPSSFFVKKLLNGEYQKNIPAELASLFFALDRFDASESLKNDIQIYDFVLANRYTTSNMIYQTAKICQNNLVSLHSEEVHSFLGWISDVEYRICSIPQPDRVIFLDIPPSIAIGLIEKKTQRSYIKQDNKDIYEKDYFFQEKVYESGVFLASLYGWENIICVQDGYILPPEHITQNILSKMT